MALVAAEDELRDVDPVEVMFSSTDLPHYSSLQYRLFRSRAAAVTTVHRWYMNRTQPHLLLVRGDYYTRCSSHFVTVEAAAVGEPERCLSVLLEWSYGEN